MFQGIAVASDTALRLYRFIAVPLSAVPLFRLFTLDRRGSGHDGSRNQLGVRIVGADSVVHSSGSSQGSRAMFTARPSRPRRGRSHGPRRRHQDVAAVLRRADDPREPHHAPRCAACIVTHARDDSRPPGYTSMSISAPATNLICMRSRICAPTATDGYDPL